MSSLIQLIEPSDLVRRLSPPKSDKNKGVRLDEKVSEFLANKLGGGRFYLYCLENKVKSVLADYINQEKLSKPESNELLNKLSEVVSILKDCGKTMAPMSKM